jgi:perosamine synthetase
MSRLAIHGGTPAVPEHIDDSRWPVTEDSDIELVTETLRSGKLSWFNNEHVPLLEREWADYVGVPYSIAVNSGTAALHAAVAAAGVGPGDEVIVPALSFLASASSVLHHQGIPVFVDVDPETFTIDPELLDEALSARTKAIVAVHLHGLPADMDRINAFAAQHGLKVIEDAAQAHGAIYHGKVVGSLGDLGAFSIMAGKNLATAGEGGLLTTSDPELRNRADSLKMFGEKVGADGARDYNARTMGWNYRLSSVLAAYARGQLSRLDRYTDEVQLGAETLAKVLADLPGVKPPVVPAGRTHVYHHFRVRFDPQEVGLDLSDGVFRKAIHDALTAEGVPVMEYQNRPLPGQMLFAERMGYGQGCPWTCGKQESCRTYQQEDYPATLDVIRSTLVVGKRLCMATFREPYNVQRYVDGFTKVFTNLDQVASYAASLGDYAEPWQQFDRLW